MSHIKPFINIQIDLEGAFYDLLIHSVKFLCDPCLRAPVVCIFQIHVQPLAILVCLVNGNFQMVLKESMKDVGKEWSKEEGEGAA